MQKKSFPSEVVTARRELISDIATSDLVRSRLINLATKLLAHSATDSDVINEVEELLAFSTKPDAARNYPALAHQAQTILGFMYKGIGQLEKAEAAFGKAYNWRPDLRQSADLLADIYKTMGRKHDAHAVMTEHQELLNFDIATLPVWSPPDVVPGAISLYLDLLEKVVCNWIYGDESHPSYGATNFDLSRRAVGRDLPTAAHSMIGRRRLRHLRWAVETVLEENVPGDLIETGAWRGGACILMRGVLAAYGAKDRKVYVADSFNGLPEPDPRFQKDMATLFDFDQRPELSVSVEDVKKKFFYI